ncbi:succinate dehydrogenase cytochrome b subunit [Nocardioides panacisoli]|uniref:succinate dehydrogenase cytochrome b subunit n=1 Tax=Nocardioides panacisoli TaxID=627624 RepID=UPI001C639607|nr:succinate dehydrogenase cytochrome b subunit [Nocardioides panacisoli]QYJ02511.1 succinate dehydrogenase cytochrome b subunit [Nocardioides panacisoli]
MATSTPNRPTLVSGARAARTTIALKLLMAVSGIIFIGFVLAHMYGNLKAFSGEEAFNDYAHHLRELGEPMLPHEGALWIIRVVLLLSLVVHVACAVALYRRAQKARPVQYQVKKNTGAIPAARMMRFGGLTILLFLIWHLLNFTIGKVNPQGGPTDEGPYALMVDSFELWWMTLIYLAAMAALGAHLHHGLWSACQTLGITGSARARARTKLFSLALAVVIAGGFALVPIGVLAGIID